MWIATGIIAEVDDVAIIRYVNQDETRRWNEHRRKGEMRLFTGWQWLSRQGNRQQQGLKTKSAAYRDAYYTLVRHKAAPRLRIVRAV
jgi:hypothetical protein